MKSLNKALAKSRTAVLISYFGLILILILNTVWLTPPDTTPIALVLIFFVGPLLIPLNKILAGITKTHIYTSFMALFYFAHAIVKFTDDEQFIGALLQLIFSLSCFTFTLVYTHFRHKSNKLIKTTQADTNNTSNQH